MDYEAVFVGQSPKLFYLHVAVGVDEGIVVLAPELLPARARTEAYAVLVRSAREAVWSSLCTRIRGGQDVPATYAADLLRGTNWSFIDLDAAPPVLHHASTDTEKPHNSFFLYDAKPIEKITIGHFKPVALADKRIMNVAHFALQEAAAL